MQFLYDCDGVRVVETQMSLCSQESFEVVPEWPEDRPVPRYLTPHTKGAFHRLLDNVSQRLGLRERSSSPPSPSLPDQKVMNIADLVSALTTSLYHTVYLWPLQ